MNKKTTRTRAEAKKLMWEYYRENKASLSKWVRSHREQIIQDITFGTPVETAFQQYSENVELNTIKLHRSWQD
jgi:hypothetical protein